MSEEKDKETMAPPGVDATDDTQPNGSQEPAGEAAAAEQAAPGSEGFGEAESPDIEQELRQAMDGLQDKHLRLQAEFENYKKRIQKEHAESMKYALTPLLRDLIGIMDNLERAVEHARAEQGDNPLLEGIEMVVKQMHGVFEKFGLTRIEAVGQPFDPNRHEAMTVVETNEVPENQVVEEFQSGYLLNERVVRPAMVSVAKNASQANA